MLHFDRITVTGKTLGESIKDVEIKDEEVIHKYENAYSKRGGLSILFGNLAPKGSVVKVGGVSAGMMQFEGPAVIFESQDEAMAGILAGKVKAGDCVVVRYEGPKGGPGMQEMLSPTSVSPEAAAGGPIGALKAGDVIQIDLVARSLNVKLTDAEIQSRLEALPPFKSTTTSKWLKRYSHFVTSADTGAILES